MLVRNHLAVAAVTAAGLFSICAPAHAAVSCAIVNTVGTPDLQCATGDKDEAKLYEIKADGVDTFYNQVGKNGSVKDVMTTTNVAVDTSNGYGEVKPSKKGDAWTTTTFSPVEGSTVAWDGLFVRGQIIDGGDSYNGALFATVTDVKGNVTNFEWKGLSTKADFGTLGFDEVSGGIAIASATFSLDGTGGYFKSMKQFDVSVVSNPVAAPEPATWAMMGLGFAGLAATGYRGRRARTARALA